MPNWCNTQYVIVGDEKELEELKSVLDRMNERDCPKVSNDFGHMWLGELVTELGFDWNERRCRGIIMDYGLKDGILFMDQETAWCEQEGVRESIEERFPSLTVYFLEEELGCGIFRTNDAAGDIFADRYLLVSETDWEYFNSKESMDEYLSKNYGDGDEVYTYEVEVV